jgi:hypothetical protein
MYRALSLTVPACHSKAGLRQVLGCSGNYSAARLNVPYIRRGPPVEIFSVPMPKNWAAAYGSVSSGKLSLCLCRRRSCISVCLSYLYRNIRRTKIHAAPSRTSDIDYVLGVSCSLPVTRRPSPAINYPGQPSKNVNCLTFLRRFQKNGRKRRAFTGAHLLCAQRKRPHRCPPSSVDSVMSPRRFLSNTEPLRQEPDNDCHGSPSALSKL